jgi:hypothetical protein
MRTVVLPVSLVVVAPAQAQKYEKPNVHLGLLPRPRAMLPEEGIRGFTASQTDEFPFFHIHSASENTAKRHAEPYVFQWTRA